MLRLNTIQYQILTAGGRTQCRNLCKTFPHHHIIDLILSSPHRRAIETTIFAFSNTLIRPDVRYLLVPDAQEVSAKACDVGFPLDTLMDVEIPKLFTDAGLVLGAEKIGFALMEGGWNLKKDAYAPNPEVVRARAAVLRTWLYGLEEKHVVLVTHGAFLRYLAEDRTADDSERGARYINCEVRTFTFTKGSTLEEAHIAEVGQEKRGKELILLFWRNWMRLGDLWMSIGYPTS